MPIPVLLAWDLVAPMLGITRGTIDEFVDRLAGTSGPGRTADSWAVHLRLSQASAEADAAQALMAAGCPRDFPKGRGGRELHSPRTGEVLAGQGVRHSSLPSGGQPVV